MWIAIFLITLIGLIIAVLSYVVKTKKMVSGMSMSAASHAEICAELASLRESAAQSQLACKESIDALRKQLEAFQLVQE
jgi:hypothetical protein